MPQRKLAEELDVDVAIISRIENESKFPKKRVRLLLGSLSKVFNVPLSSLTNMYLADQISDMLCNEPEFEKILDSSRKKIRKSLIQNSYGSN